MPSFCAASVPTRVVIGKSRKMADCPYIAFLIDVYEIPGSVDRAGTHIKIL